MRIVDYLVCEDVRNETHNKLSLMGLYQDAINVETRDPSTVKFPIQIRFALMIRVEILDGELESQVDTPIEIVVKFNDEEVLKTDGGLRIGTLPTIVNLQTTPVIATLASFGLFTFEVRLSQHGELVAELKEPRPFPFRLRVLPPTPT